MPLSLPMVSIPAEEGIFFNRSVMFFIALHVHGILASCWWLAPLEIRRVSGRALGPVLPLRVNGLPLWPLAIFSSGQLRLALRPDSAPAPFADIFSATLLNKCVKITC